ncbi:hypothetical protein NCAS_0F03590 [Naumovozyma castellii]|uniref:Integral membrane protein n=1 Tax=Naumovozyma castellii TaxID=27288 RepID=G0VH70_NAUCA|nr:hypothetical protein NCAS_0F03590 [Naumovozyma castellii CBS 4309]CCC70843.1 hypothetical protein NCAS_0F03590 [Naumovozyma castellii CBS 4309]
MRSFITNNDIPIGYITPKFPSLYWPINNKKYDITFLYNISDIWKFTLYWTLIFNAAFYGAAGLLASFSHRRTGGGIWIMVIYLTFAGVQGLAMGTIMGFLIGAIYGAGLFAMSTWIPLCCAVAQILFDVIMAYSSVSGIL